MESHDRLRSVQTRHKKKKSGFGGKTHLSGDIVISCVEKLTACNRNTSDRSKRMVGVVVAVSKPQFSCSMNGRSGWRKSSAPNLG